jgi:hypothetical protein
MRMFHNMLCKSRCSVAAVCWLVWYLHAQFVQHAEAAWYSLQGLSEVNTLQQVHRCLLANCAGFFDQMHLFAAICCCAVASCTGFVHHANTAGYSCRVSDRVNTQTRIRCTSMLCIWSAACLQAVLNTVVCIEACTGFVQHGNTGTGCRHV